MLRKNQFYIYLVATIMFISCGEDEGPIQEQPLGQVKLNLATERDIAGEIFDLEIIDDTGATIESIANLSEPPEFIELEDGAYKISISSQNQEITNFGDVVFNGVSDLFEIGRSDTLEVAVNLVFDHPLGQVKLNLIADKDIIDEEFDIVVLDNNDVSVKSITNITESPEYIALEDGDYKISISSQNQEITNFGDLVFNGVSDLFEISLSDTLEVAVNLVFDDPLGQVKLSLIADKDISEEEFDIVVLDNNDVTIKSFTNVLESPEYIALEDGDYKISVSSQNQEITKFGDVVFSGVSDLFEVSRSDTLEVSMDLVFELPLGQVKIVLSGLDIGSAPFSLITLDADSNMVETQSGLQETSPYLALDSGSYQYAIQSSLRSYTTVEDLVFSGYTEEFNIEKGDTLVVDIELGFDARLGWLSVPNVPIGKRFGSSSFIIDNNIYIGFGSSFSNERFQDWWVYSIDNNSWRQLDDFPGGKRFAALSFNIGSKGYICLSYDEVTNQLSELWEFDSTTESWNQLDNFPGGWRSAGVVFVIENKAYIGSGISNGVNPRGDFYSFDQSNSGWTQITDFIGDPTYGFTSFTIEDKGHLVGGVTNVSGETGQDVRTSQHAEYRSSNQSWTELSPFPGIARLEGVGFTIGGKGYFGLGSITNITAGTDLWVYDPSNATWLESTSFVGAPRFSTIHGSNGALGYFGFGQKGGTEYNDLYLFYPTN